LKQTFSSMVNDIDYCQTLKRILQNKFVKQNTEDIEVTGNLRSQSYTPETLHQIPKELFDLNLKRVKDYEINEYNKRSQLLNKVVKSLSSFEVEFIDAKAAYWGTLTIIKTHDTFCTSQTTVSCLFYPLA